MENEKVVFEVRICPETLVPKTQGGKPRSKSHTAFMDINQPNASWNVCLIKNGKPAIFPSRDQQCGNHPWSDDWANIYHDYCVYYGREDIGYRRIRERITKINGIMLDFDHHSIKDHPLDQIAKILLSDEFNQEVPYSMILMSGNGYQLHFKNEIIVGTDPMERAATLNQYSVTINALIQYFKSRWSLAPDESCKDPNRLHRVKGTWNTKKVKCYDDIAARKAVVLIKEKDSPAESVAQFIQQSIEKYGITKKQSLIIQTKTTADAEEIKDAIFHIDPQTLAYHEWIQVGMALHSWDADKGLMLWDEWSQRDGARYNSNEIDYKWSSFSDRGVTIGTLFHLAKEHGWQRKPGNRKDQNDSRPVVLLPGNGVEIRTAGKKLGELLKNTKRIYRRGKAVFRLQNDDAGKKILRSISDNEACSLFEYVAQLHCVRKNDPIPTVASSETASKILVCPEFLKIIPRVTIVTNSPVLADGKDPLDPLREITGYDETTGTLSYGTPTEEMPLEQAVQLLKKVVEDFNFVSPNDRARALAGIITPALVFGGLINGRSPVDMTEADQPQAGKGFRNKIVAAIYNEKLDVVTVKKSGVGGLEESFDTALVNGKPFISIDNVRGKIDSQRIESFMTEDSYHARIPYCADADIDPRRYIIMMTSNKADASKDFSKRMVIVGIRKRPDNYPFAEYPEGNILDHIRVNQPRYLGAVYSIVRAWHKAGKPRSKVAINDAFSVWFSTLEWIVTNLLGEASIVVGHKEAQDRIASPLLGWIRDVALAVKECRRLGQELRTSELLDIIETCGLEIPFISSHYDTTNEDEKSRILQTMGRKLNPVFANGCMTIDNFRIEQIKKPDTQYRDIKVYVFHEITELADPQKTLDPREAPCAPTVDPREKTLDPRVPREESKSFAKDFFKEESACGEIFLVESVVPSGGTRGSYSSSGGTIAGHSGIQGISLNTGVETVKNDALGHTSISEYQNDDYSTKPKSTDEMAKKSRADKTVDESEALVFSVMLMNGENF